MLDIAVLSPDGPRYYVTTVASGVEDYYLGHGEAPGYWVGESSKRFALHGQVGERDLVLALAGLDPRTGEALTGKGRGRKRTVPGYDAAFRAPKSVALLWALGDVDTSRIVRRAHDRAVAEAVGYLERNAVYVRRRGQQIPAEGVVAAAFRHRTSRAGDPLLHTHVVIANQGYTADDDTWRALDGRVLRHHKLTGGYIYQAVLRHDLVRDLGAAWAAVTKGYADLAGVPRRVIEAFSTRSREKNEMLRQLGVSGAKAAQMAVLATRRAKTKPPATAVLPAPGSRDYQVDPGALQQRWKDQAEQLGWPAERLSALLHAEALQPVTVAAAGEIAEGLAELDGLTAHQSVFTRQDAIRGWAQALPQGIRSAAQLEALADALLDDRAGAVVRLTRDDADVGGADRAAVDQVIDRLAAGLQSDAAAAVRAAGPLAEAVGRALAAGTLPDQLVAALTARELHSADDPAAVLVWRARLLAPPPPTSAGGGVIRLADGTTVTAQLGEHRYTTRDLLALEQRLLAAAAARRGASAGLAAPDCLDEALAADPGLTAEQVGMVRSLTGSGDGVQLVYGPAGSGKTRALAAACAAWQASGVAVTGTALSARAAAELADKAGIPSVTVAKLLAGADQGGGLPDGGVLIVDEAAMVGTRQLAQLLDLAEQAQAKVVLTGDHRQLPEIEAGGAFRRLHGDLEPVELTANQRQQRPEDRHALALLRDGRVDEALAAFAADGSVVVTDEADEMLERIAADWWSAAADPDDPAAHGVMLAVRRADVAELNNRARARLRQLGRLAGDQVEAAGRQFAVGDAVVCTRNARTLGVHNGLRGRVTAVDPVAGTVQLRVGDGDVRQLPRSYLQEGHLLHGYAMTVHRVQGADLPMAWVHSGVLYQEAAYTALSRHIHAATLYTAAARPVPEWVEHPQVLAEDPRTPLQRLTHTVSASHAQRLAVDHLDDDTAGPDDRDRDRDRKGFDALLAAALDDTTTPPAPQGAAPLVAPVQDGVGLTP